MPPPSSDDRMAPPFCILGRQEFGRREIGPAEEGEQGTRIASADPQLFVEHGDVEPSGCGEDTRR